jgi:hypothetical protein
MTRQTVVGAVLCACLSLEAALALMGGLLPGQGRAATGPTGVRVGDFTLSGPQTHDNLSVFLIHGEDRLEGKTFLTLQEALAAKKAVVHETGDVNRLEVENQATDVEVFVQSGDVVKGGRQDRVIAFDLVLPPKSGKVPVIAFCVDQNRWQRRGKEAVRQFGSSTVQLPSKSLKLLGGQYGQLGGQVGMQGGTSSQLVQPGGQLGQLGGQFGLRGGMGGQLGQLGGQFGGQGGVWVEITALQQKLRKNAGARFSGNSLQLTLENRKVQEAVGRYVKKLSAAPDGQKDVIGFAFAINGKVNSAEVYASSALFRKLWPKLLKASATEALVELQKSKTFPRVTAEDVRACMVDAEKGKKVEKDVTWRIQALMQETDRNILLQTRDRERKGVWIHRTYLTK